MNHYRRINPSGGLKLVDFSHVDVIPDDCTPELEEMRHALHVPDTAGETCTDVNAFLQIWSAFLSTSRYPTSARIFSLPVVYPFSRLGYALFARYRHLLPRRRC